MTSKISTNYAKCLQSCIILETNTESTAGQSVNTCWTSEISWRKMSSRRPCSFSSRDTLIWRSSICHRQPQCSHLTGAIPHHSDWSTVTP